MDERQIAQWSRAFLISGLSLMVSGAAIGIAIYILLPIEVALGIAAVVALISAVIGIRAIRTLKALAKAQAEKAKSALDESSPRSS